MKQIRWIESAWAIVAIWMIVLTIDPKSKGVDAQADPAAIIRQIADTFVTPITMIIMQAMANSEKKPKIKPVPFKVRQSL